MCGIVAYFGAAGNNLARVLTGMAAITYRAPDSTGVGLFGDDRRPIRTLKSLGDATALLDKLHRAELFPVTEHRILTACRGEISAAKAGELQNRLLKFESLDASPAPEEPFPDYLEVIGLETGRAARLKCGQRGRPLPMEPLTVRSRSDLVRAVDRLETELDVSPVGVYSILHTAISDSIAADLEALPNGIIAADVLAELDVILDAVMQGIRSPKPQRPPRAADGLRAPYVRKYVWRLLSQTPLNIPAEYDRDGVRGVFRLLDAALLSRLPDRRDLRVQVQQRMQSKWPAGGQIEWRVLYGAEKALNVYGRAAEAAYFILRTTLQQDSGLSGADADPAAEVAETTDPDILQYFTPPVLAHGRWALQSSVTEENAHPFLDHNGHRALVLNGKFDSRVEAEVRRYLEEVCQTKFRSENSTECLALLWGFYADQLHAEQQRCSAIIRQSEAGLTDLGLGSLSIDYHIHRRLQDLPPEKLDEVAFLEAVRCMSRRGGQLAVCGMSLQSPGRLYIASHNRPVFIVRRLDNADLMVVSDINAALGLFPQPQIQKSVRSLKDSRRRYRRKIRKLRAEGASEEILARREKKQHERESALLQAFAVEVIPLEGEERFAVAQVACDGGNVTRNLRLADFDGRAPEEKASFQSVLQPPWLRKDLHGSYYEMHLGEIPDLLRGLHRQYAPEGRLDPEMGIRRSTLIRRFGSKLETLRRIYLIGMGSSYNMGLAAEEFFRRMVPDKFVKTIMPVEIDDLYRSFDPDVDLLVMISWSSTTADMVEFAKLAASRRLAMIGVTEKVFGDLALITARSGGVMAVQSGEEVTVSALKSSLCSLYCLFLLGIWLARQSGRRQSAEAQLRRLLEIPEAVEVVLRDEELRLFSGRIASEFGLSHAAVVIDDAERPAVAREAAFKLEENSWTSIGKTADYGNPHASACCRGDREALLLVNVTRRSRLKEAVALMGRLHAAGLAFAAVGFPSREMKAIARYSSGRCAFLPKVDDWMQPFVDLPFYYLLAYFYGIARGRSAGEFPRNRAKSLTAGRSRNERPVPPSAQQDRLEADNRFLLEISPPANPVDTSRWQQMASNPPIIERTCRVAEMLSASGALDQLVDIRAELDAAALKRFRNAVDEEGRLLLVYEDRSAEVAAQAAAHVWGSHTGCPLEVAPASALDNGLHGLPLIFVGSGEPGSRSMKPGPQSWSLQIVGRSPREDRRPRWEELYAGLVLVLARLWSAVDSGTAETITVHMQTLSTVFNALLRSGSLQQDITHAARENRRYRTATLITASRAVGMQWEDCFDRAGGLLANWRLMSEIAHGSLVTVDSNVRRKFLPLESASHTADREDAFYAEGHWFLPQLRPDYDPTADNLIVLDATSEDHRERIQDELSVLGCRYARLIVLTQSSLWSAKRGRIFGDYPISGQITLPEPADDERVRPISGFLLPLILSPVFTALAGEFSRLGGPSPGPS